MVNSIFQQLQQRSTKQKWLRASNLTVILLLFVSQTIILYSRVLTFRQPFVSQPFHLGFRVTMTFQFGYK